MEQDKNNTKKVYRSPELLVYGDIGEITRAASTMGTVDDNGKGTDKT